MFNTCIEILVYMFKNNKELSLYYIFKLVTNHPVLTNSKSNFIKNKVKFVENRKRFDVKHLHFHKY